MRYPTRTMPVACPIVIPIHVKVKNSVPPSRWSFTSSDCFASTRRSQVAICKNARKRPNVNRLDQYCIRLVVKIRIILVRKIGHCVIHFPKFNINLFRIITTTYCNFGINYVEYGACSLFKTNDTYNNCTQIKINPL